MVPIFFKNNWVCIVYNPRLTTEGTFSPASSHSPSNNSPGDKLFVRLVKGTMIKFLPLLVLSAT